MSPRSLESTNGKKGNENVFVADAIRDAEFANSRNSNGASAVHGVKFPGMKIAVSDGRITREKNYQQTRIENLRVIGKLMNILG